jgi:hypothetical protein
MDYHLGNCIRAKPAVVRIWAGDRVTSAGLASNGEMRASGFAADIIRGWVRWILDSPATDQILV